MFSKLFTSHLILGGFLYLPAQVLFEAFRSFPVLETGVRSQLCRGAEYTTPKYATLA